jgi:hypothetical protein
MDDFHFVDQYWGTVAGIENNAVINIYPNPTAGDLYIKRETGQFADASIQVFTLDGRPVYNATNVTEKMQLNLPNGTYFLRYSTEKEYSVKKLVILR